MTALAGDDCHLQLRPIPDANVGKLSGSGLWIGEDGNQGS